MMKKSSRNRLTPHQQALFRDDTLFHKIARAVCRAGTLPRKELHEAWEMAKRIRRRFRGGRILDLASGHGLLAHIMMILDNTSPMALAVDKRVPKNAEKLSKAIIKTWPGLENRIQYREIKIEKITVLESDIVVSAHACGELTDLVLEKAMEKQARVAVLPCCHNLKKSSDCGLGGWMDKTLAVDTGRAIRLQKNGYNIFTMKIPGDITPKNRLLMGEYKKSG